MMVTSPLCSLGQAAVAPMTRMLGRDCGDVTMATVDRLRARHRAVTVVARRCGLDAWFCGVMAVMGRCGGGRGCVSMVRVVSYGRWRGDRVMAVVMIRRGSRDA